MAKQKQPKPDEGIAEVKQYINKLGMQVHVFVPLDGGPKFTEGVAAVDIGEGMANVRFGFPVGISLKKAFQTFEAEKAKARDEVLKRRAQQQAASKIVTPNGMLPGGLPPGDLKIVR